MKKNECSKKRHISAAIVLLLGAMLLSLPVAGLGGTKAGATTYHTTGVSQVPDTIRVLMPEGSVVQMDMDEYLKGVVPSEIGSDSPFDAQAAQAVAARCYAATAHRHSDVGADVCTTTHCQAWSSKHYQSTDVAVEATHGVAALYQGEIIAAYYFGHCNGHTKNVEDEWGSYLPYCRSVSCPCGNTTYYGHGVGMCQEGAIVLAKNGWGYADILKHYYTGVEVESTEQASLDWYFAEGTTRPGFDTYLCVGNPSDAQANITVSYMVDGGGNKDVNYTVAAKTRKTIVPINDIGSGKDFSCRVASTNNVSVIAERPMYFDYKGQWTGGHDTMGAPYPKSSWYFAEGTTRPGFDTYLCVGNPTGTAAEVSITYMNALGESAKQQIKVPAGARATISCNDYLKSGASERFDFMTEVKCTSGTSIVVERASYFTYNGVWTGGSDCMGR